ncbi:MAG: hypothetical protein ABSB35_38750, partial [Bryobacteraceae bacterium]
HHKSTPSGEDSDATRVASLLRENHDLALSLPKGFVQYVTTGTKSPAKRSWMARSRPRNFLAMRFNPKK